VEWERKVRERLEWRKVLECSRGFQSAWASLRLEGMAECEGGEGMANSEAGGVVECEAGNT